MSWVEGSSATVQWDAVENANYFSVKVNVFCKDGETFIASTKTGTSATRLDVQQEIHSIIEGTEYESVYVKTWVTAQMRQDGLVIMESNEVATGLYEYRISALITLSKPTDLSLSDDGILTFKYEDGFDKIDENNSFALYADLKGTNNLDGHAGNVSISDLTSILLSLAPE